MSELSLEHWLSDGKALPEGARFERLTSLSKAMLLAALANRTTTPLLVVFNTRADARNLVDNYRFFAGGEAAKRLHYFPANEFDFYRGLLPNPELLCERNVALYHALNDPQGRIFVTTTGAVLGKVVPSQEFLRAVKVIKPNDEIDRDDLALVLHEAGYQRQPAAYDPGIYAVRGGVMDIFSPLYPYPVRIEFFGDLIEEIRFFDPQNQRSLEKLDQLAVVPVGISLLPHGEGFTRAAEKIKERLDNLDVPKGQRDEILERIKEGNLSSELSYLYPLLSNGSEPLLNYFPKDTILFWDGKQKSLEQARERDLPTFYKNVELFEKAPSPIATRDELFLTQEAFGDLVTKPENRFFEDFSGKSSEDIITLKSEPISLGREREAAKQKAGGYLLLDSFARRFREWMDEGYRIQIVCHTRVHAERVQTLFDAYEQKATLHPEGEAAFPLLLNTDFSRLNLWQGFITESGKFPDLRLIVLSEEEIFGQKKRQAKASVTSPTKAAKLLSAFKDLKVNDFIVHNDHGIGRYLGLKSMNFLGVPNDYVLVEYRDGDKLYIPVYRLNVLQKYAGGENAKPMLDKLGGDRWSKAKAKAKSAVAELAAEFLKIQAKRKTIPAHPFTPPGKEFQEFEMRFPFDETPDQMKAIEDVMADMGKPVAMDRLVCGDVGYGKTEVAIRAAYRAVLDNKQVAILVPTTVLAFQHFETFKARLKETGVSIDLVCRLRTSAEIKQTIEKLKDGKVDIVVGTHRLLSNDVFFKDLGLVVVDEEHRFGVVHKERLKKMTESVHVLSMTATPIPRTLNMAMSGIKEISIITTPPPDRQSVRTFVCRQSDEVIVEAITNELAREGQVFFVHNRIEGIYEVGNELKRLLPKVKFEVVHGQMDGEELESKMLAFYAGDFQVLLTTSIIESGLDIPRANTIIIDKADHFGLAQLYQLRGRVGRSALRAYAYLLAPPEGELTEDAKQRLQVIQRYTDLGAGFNVASHDLEIRGAGDMLGKEQSGHITAVGVDMYFDLLEEAIDELRGIAKGVSIEPEISMKVPAYFPEGYLPDISERISIYRRLSSVDNEESVSEIEAEIRDRFGTLPEEVINLLGFMRLKIYLKRLHVVKMSCGPKKSSLQFAPSTPASPQKIVKLVQSDPKRYAVTPDHKLVFNAPENDWQELLKEVARLSDLLT